jgi:hypothetical protein
MGARFVGFFYLPRENALTLGENHFSPLARLNVGVIDDFRLLAFFFFSCFHFSITVLP